MKKVLVVLMALVLVALVLPGCNNKPAEETGPTHLGLGITTSIARSRDMAGETMAQAQVDTTIAAVTFDKDGKVVHVQIDVAQTRVAFGADMKVTNRDAVLKTKKELGNDYNMKRVSVIGKEWFEQMAALEAWMIGKTVTEIKALPVKVVDDAHQHVPNIDELTSSVTITVESYIAAVEAAWNNKIEVEKVAKMGLGINTSIRRSRDANPEADPAVVAQAQVDTTIAATAFDADGKVVGVLIDAAQTRVLYDADGKVATDKTAKVKTKKELGNDYNMKRVSVIGKEWFEQIAALEDWMTGRTVTEIKAMPVKVVDEAHQHVPNVEELLSSVTITIEPYMGAVEKSLANAK